MPTPTSAYDKGSCSYPAHEPQFWTASQHVTVLKHPKEEELKEFCMAECDKWTECYAIGDFENGDYALLDGARSDTTDAGQGICQILFHAEGVTDAQARWDSSPLKPISDCSNGSPDCWHFHSDGRYQMAACSVKSARKAPKWSSYILEGDVADFPATSVIDGDSGTYRDRIWEDIDHHFWSGVGTDLIGKVSMGRMQRASLVKGVSISVEISCPTDLYIFAEHTVWSYESNEGHTKTEYIADGIAAGHSPTTLATTGSCAGIGNHNGIEQQTGKLTFDDCRACCAKYTSSDPSGPCTHFSYHPSLSGGGCRAYNSGVDDTTQSANENGWKYYSLEIPQFKAQTSGASNFANTGSGWTPVTFKTMGFSEVTDDSARIKSFVNSKNLKVQPVATFRKLVQKGTVTLDPIETAWFAGSIGVGTKCAQPDYNRVSGRIVSLAEGTNAVAEQQAIVTTVQGADACTDGTYDHCSGAAHAALGKWILSEQGIACQDKCASMNMVCNSRAMDKIRSAEAIVKIALEAGVTCTNTHMSRDYEGAPYLGSPGECVWFGTHHDNAGGSVTKNEINCNGVKFSTITPFCNCVAPVCGPESSILEGNSCSWDADPSPYAQTCLAKEGGSSARRWMEYTLRQPIELTRITAVDVANLATEGEYQTFKQQGASRFFVCQKPGVGPVRDDSCVECKESGAPPPAQTKTLSLLQAGGSCATADGKVPPNVYKLLSSWEECKAKCEAL